MSGPTTVIGLSPNGTFFPQHGALGTQRIGCPDAVRFRTHEFSREQLAAIAGPDGQPMRLGAALVRHTHHVEARGGVEFEAVAKAAGRSMAQVAINWVANRPGVASVIMGATRLEQLQENLGACRSTCRWGCAPRLNAASAPPRTFPYIFFSKEVEGSIHSAVVGTKRQGYFPTITDGGRGIAS